MSKLQSEFSSPWISPGFLLWQITNKWQSEQREALNKFGLTHVQFVLLASLVWADNEVPFTQARLAEHARTDVMMTSQVLRKLEQKGLVERWANGQDGRSLVVRPTPAGVRLANWAVRKVEAADQQFFGVISEDLEDFTRLIRRLSQN